MVKIQLPHFIDLFNIYVIFYNFLTLLSHVINFVALVQSDAWVLFYELRQLIAICGGHAVCMYQITT